MTAEPLIVNLAATGMVPTKADNPAVPLAPAEIAEDCRRCAAAGATVVHVHARDAEGRPTYRKEVFRETITLIRAALPDMVVCVTTSGRLYKDPEQRGEVLDLDGAVKPDMASLTLGSMNFPREASVNAPRTIRALADRMRERGIVPELEIFDVGMLDYAHYLIERGVLREPFYFNLLLGSLGTLAATPLHLAQLVAALPAGATWAAAGIGRFQLPMNALAVAMGGQVRVGLEDNLFLDTAKQCPATNLSLVERVVGIARAMGRPVATCTQARRRIGLGDPPRA
ncbi:MAG TPA: 3-keto-5-aminohexanoate cleavage protein [Vicinamibacteria bacterium]|nr:3-keto-5-aminohexanoate cleavage protein [Vicinamibacteria bacterium]